MGHPRGDIWHADVCHEICSPYVEIPASGGTFILFVISLLREGCGQPRHQGSKQYDTEHFVIFLFADLFVAGAPC
jgi:hypothetical protein